MSSDSGMLLLRQLTLGILQYNSVFFSPLVYCPRSALDFVFQQHALYCTGWDFLVKQCLLEIIGVTLAE